MDIDLVIASWDPDDIPDFDDMSVLAMDQDQHEGNSIQFGSVEETQEVHEEVEQEVPASPLQSSEDDGSDSRIRVDGDSHVEILNTEFSLRPVLGIPIIVQCLFKGFC